MIDRNGPKSRKRPVTISPEKICFLCGKPGADSVDHVVSRNLYPGPLPSDVLTQPAHGRCNKSTSKDEEDFRNVIAGVASENAGERALLEKAIRSFVRPEAAGMASDFQRRMQPLPEGGGIISIDLRREMYVLAKIAKGVTRAAGGPILLPKDVRWFARKIDPNKFADALSPLRYEKTIEGVVTVWWDLVNRTGIWCMRFYGAPWCFVISSFSSERRFANKEVGALYLPWPRA